MFNKQIIVLHFNCFFPTFRFYRFSCWNSLNGTRPNTSIKVCFPRWRRLKFQTICLRSLRVLIWFWLRLGRAPYIVNRFTLFSESPSVRCIPTILLCLWKVKGNSVCVITAKKQTLPPDTDKLIVIECVYRCYWFFLYRNKRFITYTFE